MLTSIGDQYVIERLLTDKGVKEARRAWRIGRLDLLPAAIGALMVKAAEEAEAGLAAMLAEQDLDAPAVAVVNTELYGRQATDGRSLTGLFEQAQSSVALEAMAVTQIADVWRISSGASIAARPAVSGYIRHVGPTCCSRCAILSGRFYRWSSGFLRHPRCRCINVPTTRSRWQEAAESPLELFNQGRITDLSKANIRAISDGADISQLVNATHRGRSKLALAQPTSPIQRKYGLKFTSAGSTDRSWAYQQQVGLGIRQPVRSAGTRQRLMPESIYANAGSREEALEMLRANGWIVDAQARAAGRAALDETRRIERAARRRDRREAARAATAPTTEFDRLKELAAQSVARRRGN